MTFLHWGLLPWFLPLAAIPIVLHLLTLHRLRTVELSTYRFLFDSYVQQRRKMKFLEALLAALRTLFLLLFVFTISRPAVRHWSQWFGGTGREIVALVDVSASMNARTDGVSSLDRAKSALSTLAKRLGPDDRLTVVKVGGRAEEVFSRFSSDSQAVQQKIDQISVGPSRGNIYAGLNRVFSTEAFRQKPPVVYVFSDFQASGWKELREQTLEGLAPAEANLLFVQVGARESIPNIAVLGSAPRRLRAVVGLPVTLKVAVANFAKQDAADTTVSFLVDDQESARLNLSIKPGEVATKEVIYTPTRPGFLRCRFETPTDRFPDDNVYQFGLTVSPLVKILLINGNPSGNLLDNECVFLRAALAGGEDPRSPNAVLRNPEDREILRSLEVREIHQGYLNPEILKDIAVVILANCGELNDQHFEWLREYTRMGGGLVVFPGDRVNPEVYNKRFFTLPGPQNTRMLPIDLGVAEGELDKPETFDRWSGIDFSHPALTVFDKPKSRYFSNVQFARRYPLKLTNQANDIWALARFSGQGKIALAEGRYGEGVVLLASFPATSKWSNLPLRPEFVPLLLRLIHQAEGKSEVEAPATVSPDGIAELALKATWEPAQGKVTAPSGQMTEVGFNRSGARLLGAFEKTNEKGFYTAEVKAGGSLAGRTAETGFAVNLSALESNFEWVTPSQIESAVLPAKAQIVDASAEAQRSEGDVGDQREIWRLLIGILFAIIGCEFLLSTLGNPNADENQPTVTQRLLSRIWPARANSAETPAKSTVLKV